MVKTLVSKLKKRLKKEILLGSAMASLWGFASCKFPPQLPDDSPIKENNFPIITSNPITPFDEKSDYSYPVEAEDEDGDNLEYSFIEKPEWLNINSNVINGITPDVGADTSYRVVIKVSDGKDFSLQGYDLIIKDKDITLPDYVDISGRLEDNENDGTGRQGVIRVYENNTDKTFLGQFLTDDPVTDPNPFTYGDFSFTLNKTISQLINGIILQAGIDNNRDGTLESYVRTITLPAGDHNPITDSRGNPAIRVVPYDGLVAEGVSKEDFRAHMDEVNFVNIPDYGLFKYDLLNVEIIKNNPFVNAYFLDSEVALIKSKIINDINDIRAYVEGNQLFIDESPIKHYDEDFVNKIITPHNGWIVVLPVRIDTTPPYEYENDTEIPGAGGTIYYNSGLPQVFGSAKILLYEKTNSVISHEFGHALAFPEHAITIPPEKTIMYWSGNLPTPSPIDKKAAKIVYEETYPARESLDSILRIGWGFD